MVLNGFTLQAVYSHADTDQFASLKIHHETNNNNKQIKKGGVVVVVGGVGG